MTMTSNTLTISGKYELLALHRALMEARFCSLAHDPDVSASSILANLHRSMMPTLAELAQEEPRSGKRWGEWLVLDEGRWEWRVALAKGADSVLWRLMDATAKSNFAEDLLAPFTVNDQIKAHFVSCVEQEIARRRHGHLPLSAQQ